MVSKGRFMPNSPNHRDDEIRKSIKKGVMLVVFDEMEKVRRYWAFRFGRLLQMGLEADTNVDLKIDGNRMVLTITVNVPETFYDKSVEEILRRRERSINQRVLWGEEMRAEEELKSEEEDKSNLEEEDVEVELVEGDKNPNTR